MTKGCNPPANTEFCPSDNVTREQMAAFMNRLANNGVVDAGWLGGMTADEIVAAADAAAQAAVDAQIVNYLVEMNKGDDPVVFAEIGPLTFTANCEDDAGDTRGFVEYTSSVGPWWEDATEYAAGDIQTPIDDSTATDVAEYNYWYEEIAVPSEGVFVADDGYKNTLFLEHGSEVDCVFAGTFFPHIRGS